VRLIIVGSGRCVWDDLEKLLPIECDVMAVNDAIMHYPYKLTHAYSIDNSMLNEWVAARRPWYKKLDGVVRKHCLFKCPGAEKQELKVHANSGLNSVYCALDLGYTEIVVCGVPLDNSGHYWGAHWEKSNYEEEDKTRKRPRSDQIMLWKEAKATVFEGRVFSMSGRTRDILGLPPWLDDSKDEDRPKISSIV